MGGSYYIAQMNCQNFAFFFILLVRHDDSRIMDAVTFNDASYFEGVFFLDEQTNYFRINMITMQIFVKRERGP